MVVVVEAVVDDDAVPPLATDAHVFEPDGLLDDGLDVEDEVDEARSLYFDGG